MRDDKSVQDAPVVSHDRVVECIRKQLRTAVVVERRMTVEDVARDSGVKKETVESYMRNDGAKEPSTSRALSIAFALGPRAVQAMMALIGYSASPLEEPDALLPMQIVSDALNHLSVIGQAAVDNRIDHIEEPRTTAAADMLIATVLPLSSAGKGAS